MSTNKFHSLDENFDDHASLSASLEDFEPNDQRSPMFGLPSQHSGFKSEESEEPESSSEGPWSPPAWKTQNAGSGWYRHQPYLQRNPSLRPSVSASHSRDTSPRYEDAREEGDVTLAANIPLPRGSLSPVKERTPSPSPYHETRRDSGQTRGQEERVTAAPHHPNNYFRFAVRAEVQHRTEPIDAALSYLRTYFNYLSKSWSTLIYSIFMVFVAISAFRILIRTPASPPVPDLVKVAGLARSFEPLIYYSENGVRQISDLQETGVAVWDLGESVRAANMTSAPIIVDELDNLSDSLKTLAIELTKFFANVDGDIDGILIVMEWAKRELTALSSQPISALSSAFTNIHSLLSTVGILEHSSTGVPTAVGKIVTTLFGSTHTQRTRATLHRTFHEFLSVLEESINAELTYSTALFSLFSTIDRQFLNLQRTVIRESNTQERLEGEFLSSLWTRVLGPNASILRKYEKNKTLLMSVRAKTASNKSLLVEHNGKLVTLKGNLEALRRKLISPLVRREGEGREGVVEEQIEGLVGTYQYLKGVRERQKGRVLEVLYGGGRKVTIGREDGEG